MTCPWAPELILNVTVMKPVFLIETDFNFISSFNITSALILGDLTMTFGCLVFVSFVFCILAVQETHCNASRSWKQGEEN